MVHALVTFVIAASLLVVLAGPDSLLVLRSRTAARVLTGLAVWVVAAALGRSPLLWASHTRYTALRLVGAAYSARGLAATSAFPTTLR